ncbi:hypothetical protein P5G51_013695 [Virgibacillus sp. 179-BFC.A HS]|uniref:Uncharacterized protein n=1 Tax=Tigheibacillus jepli TaxID=3035914 RepID=A0ABU5CKG1_9BACI|nr:hypothetical protein [Virgibacillus sp. 179-BFC.A HS]MDY0406304.1 hypothetical protein [Virgibacillus sp. 179-BFC.A HS]
MLSDGKYVREYVGNGKIHYAFVDAIPKDRLEPELGMWKKFVIGAGDVLKTTGSGIKGFGIGAYDVGKDMVVGVYDLVTDPIGTAEALGNMNHEAVIEVPKGTTLNIGRAEKQITKTGAVMHGDADKVLLPLNYPLDWIKEIWQIPSR